MRAVKFTRQAQLPVLSGDVLCHNGWAKRRRIITAGETRFALVATLMKMGFRLVSIAALQLLAGACGDDPSFELPPTTYYQPISEEDSGADRVAPCDGAPDGTPCGAAGANFHCVFNACQKNVCGDGVVVTGDEDCDDGNDRDGDGCDSSCRREPAGRGTAGRAAAGRGGAGGASGRGGVGGASGRSGASGAGTGGRGVRASAGGMGGR